MELSDTSKSPPQTTSPTHSLNDSQNNNNNFHSKNPSNNNHNDTLETSEDSVTTGSPNHNTSPRQKNGNGVSPTANNPSPQSESDSVFLMPAAPQSSNNLNDDDENAVFHSGKFKDRVSLEGLGEVCTSLLSFKHFSPKSSKLRPFPIQKELKPLERESSLVGAELLTSITPIAQIPDSRGPLVQIDNTQHTADHSESSETASKKGPSKKEKATSLPSDDPFCEVEKALWHLTLKQIKEKARPYDMAVNNIFKKELLIKAFLDAARKTDVDPETWVTYLRDRFEKDKKAQPKKKATDTKKPEKKPKVDSPPANLSSFQFHQISQSALIQQQIQSKSSAAQQVLISNGTAPVSQQTFVSQSPNGQVTLAHQQTIVQNSLNGQQASHDQHFSPNQQTPPNNQISPSQQQITSNDQQIFLNQQQIPSNDQISHVDQQNSFHDQQISPNGRKISPDNQQISSNDQISHVDQQNLNYQTSIDPTESSTEMHNLLSQEALESASSQSRNLEEHHVPDAHRQSNGTLVHQPSETKNNLEETDQTDQQSKANGNADAEGKKNVVSSISQDQARSPQTDETSQTSKREAHSVSSGPDSSSRSSTPSKPNTSTNLPSSSAPRVDLKKNPSDSSKKKSSSKKSKKQQDQRPAEERLSEAVVEWETHINTLSPPEERELSKEITKKIQQRNRNQKKKSTGGGEKD